MKKDTCRLNLIKLHYTLFLLYHPLRVTYNKEKSRPEQKSGTTFKFFGIGVVKRFLVYNVENNNRERKYKKDKRSGRFVAVESPQ